VFSQLEYAMTRKRLRDGRRKKLETDGWAGGRAPYGWRSENGQLVEVDEEQRAIALAKRERRQGRTLRQGGEEVRVSGLTRRNGSGTWPAVQVARLVSDEPRRK